MGAEEGVGSLLVVLLHQLPMLLSLVRKRLRLRLVSSFKFLLRLLKALSSLLSLLSRLITKRLGRVQCLLNLGTHLLFHFVSK